jgi:transaldolase/glucose-6-phosphate isomerase
MNPVKALQEYGQSVWLDYIRRNMLTDGELKRLIDDDGLRGVTSNPAIFEKAIAGSNDYTDQLKQLENKRDLDAMALYEQLAIRDIQSAADILAPVYRSTKCRDGYVSLEVSPYLAHDTEKTVAEAQRLWAAVGRENLMIKIPGTPEGVPAIKQAISEGINVNVTLLFSQDAYRGVLEAYVSGLETRAAKNQDVSRLASVASFFVSRIDSNVDARIAAKLKTVSNPADQALLRGIAGKVAIANAKLAYRIYQDAVASERWQALAKKGAQTQRLLWASTSTKNPAYPDTLYVTELIGPDTVNTIPPATLDAFRDHGKPGHTLTADLEDARDTMDGLARAGISMKEVTDELQVEAVSLFAEAFDKLLAAVERGRQAQLVKVSDSMAYTLPDKLSAAVKATLEDWRSNGKVRRLWARDASLWTNTDEGKWLDWLSMNEDQLAHIQPLRSVADEIKNAGFKHALLLGMGGSSLCPEVLALTFGPINGYPSLQILDSTDPQQIKALEDGLDLTKTIFIVSSKSGSTLEPNIYKQYFFDRVSKVVGAKEAPSRFIAITDPGSKLQHVAEADGFRHVFFGLPGIGGRYSALSNFGLVPGAIMGLDVAKFLDLTEIMVHSCAASVPPDSNPGVMLGAILGTLARNGRDKVTILSSAGISDLGAWLEQLLAESTGKQGKGLIPVDRERLGPPTAYGEDRLFVYLRLTSAPDAAQDAAVDALAKAGHPVVRIAVPDLYCLGQEFFRWEIATAVAGSIIGINAFNQPDVEASKIETRKLTDEYEKSGKLPPESPILEDRGVKLFADPKNAAALASAAGADKTLRGFLRAHLARINAGDYFTILAYVQMKAEHEAALSQMRHAVRDSKRVATCLGFGPRFQHSTGQAYKGGPNSGVFLQVTSEEAHDLPVPGQKYTFGVVKLAAARGDLAVLAERGRRLLRIHLGSNLKDGLAALSDAFAEAIR